ncbi:hypothetical protein ACFY9S_36055 [Streptomyces sp. NPDC012474]|uniref:hypothetical protein n=1 Tax=Streptomyces sp. NPDC012474 TaxID=3364836 RepID=UPI0036E69553
MSWNVADVERGGVAGVFLEIACDESGSDGENLTGGNTDVFAHAGVSLSLASAAATVAEIRSRIRSPAEEYKATHLLREKHRAVLEWLLAPEGPVDGRARVHLMEKAYFVVDRTLGLLLDDAAEAAVLFRAGRPVFGQEGWRAFLEAANQLLRVRHDGDPVDAFYGTVDTLRRAHPRTDAARILERLAATRPRAVAYRDGFLAGPPLIPLLNPLLPAIVRTAELWSGSGRPVHLVHDRQNMLTPERIAWIETTARRAGIGLTGLRLVVARDDARVQVADFLAGIARKIASDELNGRGDPALTALLRPFVDPGSVWDDARSGALLAAPVAG